MSVDTSFSDKVCAGQARILLDHQIDSRTRLWVHRTHPVAVIEVSRHEKEVQASGAACLRIRELKGGGFARTDAAEPSSVPVSAQEVSIYGAAVVAAGLHRHL